MTRPPEVSVVLPVRNGASTIGQQLAALAAQDFVGSWEVIVVDNGSTDDLAGAVRPFEDRLPDLRVVDASDTIGVPHARNVGSRAARGELIVLCDADDRVEPGWLRAMVVALRSCVHVGGLVDERSSNDPVALVWRVPRRRDGLQVALRFLPYAPGACCGIRRSVLDAVGGWDEAYARGGNDVELSFRVQLAGYRVCWAPDAVVHYRVRHDLAGHVRTSFRTGVADARLLRDFSRHGARGRGWRDRLRLWARIAVLTPSAVVRRGPRGHVLGLVAQEAGLLCGYLALGARRAISWRRRGGSPTTPTPPDPSASRAGGR